jgi:hypothetical protein
MSQLGRVFHVEPGDSLGRWRGGLLLVRGREVHDARYVTFRQPFTMSASWFYPVEVIEIGSTAGNGHDADLGTDQTAKQP